MKRYVLSFLLLIFVSGIINGQNNEVSFHVADIYNEPNTKHGHFDTRNSTDAHGDRSNDIVYTFTINSQPTLFMANMMGSEFEATNMYLLYRPLRSDYRYSETAKAAHDNRKAAVALADQDKFDLEFDEDLTQIPLHTSALYLTLEPGEYKLYCEATEDNRIHNGNLATHMYFSPIGNIEECAFDCGSYIKNFSKKVMPGTFCHTNVYYKLKLDSLNTISIVNQGPLNMRPDITVLSQHGYELANSREYPLKDDSIPQITGCKLGAGIHHIKVSYKAENIFGKAGLTITGVIDHTGDSWERPFEMGCYSDSLNYTHSYNSEAFANVSDDNITEYVFHRFEIKDTMDISIEIPKSISYQSNSLGVTLYNADHSIIQHSVPQQYSLGIDESNLPPGTYYFTTEKGTGKLTVNIKGRKSTRYISTTKNYITTIKATTHTRFVSDLNNPSNANQAIRYADAFGRIEQTIECGETPLLKDLVTGKEYDKMYRDSCSWLPVVSSASGRYLPVAKLRDHSLKMYQDGYAYEKSTYDGSPLNRLVEKYYPGSSWHTTGHSEKLEYHTNSVDSKCRLFDVQGTKANPVLVQKGFYDAKELTVTIAKDEDGPSIYSYTNKMGQKILSRSINGKDTLDTYQVYDNFGNLCFVLPPMATEKIGTLGLHEALDLYAYQYRYDEFDQCSGKKLPGTEWIDYAYDTQGRLFLTRDNKMRKQNEWKCVFYDRLGREVITAILKSRLKYSTYYMHVDFNPNASRSFYGYVVDGINTDSLKMQQVVYYDTYDYKKIPSLYTADFNYVSDSQYGQRYGDDTNQLNCKGLVTGTMTRVVGTGQMLCSSTYYDYYQRPVQSRSTDVNGKTHIRKFKYDFAGNTLSSREEVSGVSLNRSMTYDHAGRLLKNTHLVNNSLSATLSYNYDELGRLKNVSRSNGSTPLSTTYQYNLRNWLTSIESPLFSQKLYYTDGTGVKSYNGNISSMTWKAGNEQTTRGYRFEYDSLSRMKTAAYGEGEALSLIPGKLDERVTSYDKNGNILRLKRYGQTSASGYSLMDDLTATLNGNQLMNVDDAVTGSAYNNGFEFKNGSRQSTEYSYDANGNLTKDLNKKIADIQYNYLNLPDRITFEDGGAISYLYDAAGTKLRVVRTAAGNTTTTDYCGNVIFENGNPKTVLTEAGFVSLNDNKYHYYLQDHQGNNRVVTDQNGNVEEVNHYYPFGGVFASSGNIQPYKYNGKELDMANGMNWYDYGARHYDAALGRWNAVDALSEKYYGVSPYAYCFNNPIKHIDPNGKQGVPIPMPLPLPFYYSMTYPQNYNFPSDQQIMRHTSNKMKDLGRMITDAPKTAYAIGFLLYYQTKNAISPEYNHQRNRERKSKEELDRNQANVAKSIEDNISGDMPNGDPAPKRKPEGFESVVIKIGMGATIVEDFHNNVVKRASKSSRENTTQEENKRKEKMRNNYILTPITEKLNETLYKSQ